MKLRKSRLFSSSTLHLALELIHKTENVNYSFENTKSRNTIQDIGRSLEPIRQNTPDSHNFSHIFHTGLAPPLAVVLVGTERLVMGNGSSAPMGQTDRRPNSV
jgi:hypothetical protein